jgi:hypothetical protein
LLSHRGKAGTGGKIPDPGVSVGDDNQPGGSFSRIWIASTSSGVISSHPERSP